ncbi:Uncharacterised protein [Bordetella pertussis]|nr:Uncharacterised protein [Bordetella pertussis]
MPPAWWRDHPATHGAPIRQLGGRLPGSASKKAFTTRRLS